MFSSCSWTFNIGKSTLSIIIFRFCKWFEKIKLASASQISEPFEFQIVGLAAKSGLVRNGPSTVVHNKKLLNEKIEETEIEEVVNANACKVKHEEGSIRYEIKKDDKVCNFTPEDVATCIFKKMYGKQHLLNNYELFFLLTLWGQRFH